MNKSTRIVLLACGVVAASLSAQPARGTPPARTKLLTGAVQYPICIAHTPGDAQRIYVCERTGRIRVVDTGTGAVNGTDFLSIAGQVSLDGENGLLGLAFDPDYASNGYSYISYKAVDGDWVLARYHATPGTFVADAGSAYTIWRYPRPPGHNGGWIGFSPINGLLYISSGDGDLGGTYDAANRAQTTVDQPMGKILRINPDSDDFPADPNRNYHIPAGNPFVGVVGDDEIWAYGVRNPWRCSFDRTTGDFYFGDVGMDDYEEVNREPASSPGGRNYGWPCMEGSNCTISNFCVCGDPSLTLPLYDFPHTLGACVTGGYVYRGADIPDFQGVYVFGDFSRRKVWSLRPQAAGGYTEFLERTSEFVPPGTSAPISWIAAFGEDAAGELYICDIFNSKIYKVVPYPCLPVIDVPPPNASQPVHANIVLNVLGAGADPLTYRWRKGGIDLSDGGRISGSGTATLSISDAQLEDAGDYDVVLTSPCGSTPSPSANVSIFTCRSADFNGNGAVTVQDLFNFLAAWFSNAPAGDFNQSGQNTVQDVFDYLFSWFSQCL